MWKHLADRGDLDGRFIVPCNYYDTVATRTVPCNTSGGDLDTVSYILQIKKIILHLNNFEECEKLVIPCVLVH